MILRLSEAPNLTGLDKGLLGMSLNSQRRVYVAEEGCVLLLQTTADSATLSLNTDAALSERPGSSEYAMHRQQQRC